MKKMDSKTIIDLIPNNISIRKSILFNSIFDLPIGFEGKIIPNKTLGDLQANTFIKENGQTFVTLSLKGQSGSFYELNLTSIFNQLQSTSIECQNARNQSMIKRLEERILTPTGKIKRNAEEKYVAKYQDLISLPSLSSDEVMSNVENRLRFALELINLDKELFQFLKSFNFSLYIEKNGVFEKQQFEKTIEQINLLNNFVEENTVLYQGKYDCYYDRTLDDSYDEEEVEFNFSQKIFVLDEFIEAISHCLTNSVNDFLRQYGL